VDRLNVEDFFYTCQSHLNDHAFVTSADPPSPEPVSKAEIDKIKKEWDEKQKMKKENEEKKEKEKEKDKDKDKGKDKSQEKENKEKSSLQSLPGSYAEPSSRSNANSSSHRRYILNSPMFRNRESAWKRKAQAVQASDASESMPTTPSSLPLSSRNQ